MNILITGGVGFIGTNTAIFFAKNKNNQITIVDNFSREGVDKNAAFLKKNYSNINIVKSNIADVNKYLSELKKADAIIHLAGQTAVTTSIANPLLDFQSNLYGGFLLLESVRKNNPNAAVIFSSTNKVYGDLKNISRPQGIEEKEKLDFISPYGCSKGSLDLYFLDYHRIFDLNTVVFRQSCIYGPHQIGVEDQGWVAHFAKQFFWKKPITIFGDGKQIRDLLYVDDLISAYKIAIDKIKKIKGQVFNIGGGAKNSYSLLQVIDMLEKYFQHKVKINFDKERVGDQKFFISANKKIKTLLGWQPKTDFKDGLNKLIVWQKNNL